ncbi:MAG: glycosyltransferase family 2 protein [Bdellovibrio sp.]|nr:glycosyltransferase family 2 protein [Bdellovibrio sp.]
MKVLIAIPCYNCEKQISRVLTKIERILKSAEQVEGIVVIDNRSNDQTVAVAKRTLEKIKFSIPADIYVNEANYGLGGSHKVAFKLCEKYRCDYLAIVHGDDQANPDDLIRLIKAAVINKEQTVLGSRFMAENTLSNYSPARRRGNKALNFLYSILTLTEIEDLGSGLNLFYTKYITPQILNNCDNDFTFNMDLLLNMVKHKIKFIYRPIFWKSEDEISNAKAFDVGYQSTVKILKWCIGKDQKMVASFDTYNTKKVL